MSLSISEFKVVHEVTSFEQRNSRDVGDALVVDFDGENLRLQSSPVAVLAGHFTQVLGPACTLHIRLGLKVLSLNVRNNALKTRRVLNLATVPVLPLDTYVEVVAVENSFARVFVEILPRRCQ